MLPARYFVLITACLSAFAFPAAAQIEKPKVQIVGPIDENQRVVLRGTVHHLARPEFDRGPAPDDLPMDRIFLKLKRTPDQENLLRQLLDEQQSKSSPNYHKWLSPHEFGNQFGPAEEDIQMVTSWLESHGFRVERVNSGRTLIQFSGTASEVRSAFHTTIHRYTVHGIDYWANADDAQIPAALINVVGGPVSLNNFKKPSQLRNAGIFSRDKVTGTVTPKFEITSCGQHSICNALAPADFATIYNIPSNANGSGQTIAIVGDSEICTASSPDFSECTGDDVARFRTLFNLPSVALPQIVVVGSDPLFNADETEGDLDLQWAGALAPQASMIYVIAADTSSTAGVDIAAEYIVDNNLAPVLSESFGTCTPSTFDQENGANDSYYESLWQQASAQGITVVVSAGDSGSAGCDDPDLESVAELGLGINWIAGTPFDVAAGGTDFDITAANYQSTYWSGSNNPATGQSAKSYIPETTWNDSCAQGGVSACAGAASSTLNIVAGGGGISLLSYGGTWQAGITAGGRAVPDVSFFAADGLVSGSFYIVCQSDLDRAGAPCDLSAPFPFVDFVGVGGTSASAPAFAAVMALVNQKTGGRQGNANYVLYGLKNTSGVFNDVTKGTNSVPCLGGTPHCSIVSGNGIGVLETYNLQNLPSGQEAYPATPGYDEATGLGSVNVGGLLNAWSTATGLAPSTTTITAVQPTTITHGSPVSITVQVSPPPPSGTFTVPESVSLLGTCLATNPSCFGGNSSSAANAFAPLVLASQVQQCNAGGPDCWQLVNGVAASSTTHLVGGTYDLSAHYPGDGQLGASDSAPIQITVNPEGSQILPFIMTYNFVNGGLTNPLTQATYGTLLFIDFRVQGSNFPPFGGTGTITVKDSGVLVGAGTYPINPHNQVEIVSPATSFPGNFSPTTVVPALAVGSHQFTAQYSGDASYLPSALNAPLSFAVLQAPTSSTVSAPSTVAPGASFTLSVLVDTTTATGGSQGVAPSGTVTFFNGGTQIGSPVSVSATHDPTGFVAAQASVTTSLNSAGSITATYSGDANYVGSNAAAVSVSTAVPDFVVSAGTPLTIANPGSSATSNVSVSTTTGLTGTVSLTCSVSPSNENDPPGCSFSQASVQLTASVSSASSILTITTTAASAAVGRRPRWEAPYPLAVEEYGVAILLVLGASLYAVRQKQPMIRALVATPLLVAFLALASQGCGGGGGGGGGNGGGPPPNPGTTTGQYVVTITATSGSLVHATGVTVNVQ